MLSRIFKKVISATAACSIMAAFTVSGALADISVSARSAILMEASTGRVIYEKDPDVRLPIASTTKLMTALVAVENGSPEEIVTVAPECEGVEGTSIYLRAGEKLTLRRLLYGLMLESGNDAAVAVACHIAGSVEKFAELMNERAAAMGLENTHFENPHGLNAEGHYSSARDLAKIMAEGMKNPIFAQIASTKSVSFGPVTYTNHNKLMWSFEGMEAGKTGFTKKAGRTLVTCARRGGLRLICVTLNDGDDWRDHEALYELGFGLWESREVAGAGEAVTTVPVISGESSRVPVGPEYAVSTAAPRDGELTVSFRLPEFVYAEVKRGDFAGFMEISSEGRVLTRVRLVFLADVARSAAKKPGLLGKLRSGAFDDAILNGV